MVGIVRAPMVDLLSSAVYPNRHPRLYASYHITFLMASPTGCGAGQILTDKMFNRTTSTLGVLCVLCESYLFSDLLLIAPRPQRKIFSYFSELSVLCGSTVLTT